MDVSETHYLATSQGPGDKGWKSRKFQLTAGIVILATTALFLDKIEGGDWTQIMLAAIGAYNLANAVTTYSRRQALPVGPQRPWNGPAD